MCAVIKHQSASVPSDGNPSGKAGKSTSPSKAADFEGRVSSAPDSTIAPAQKLRQMARKLSQLADDSLLCLRLEVTETLADIRPL